MTSVLIVEDEESLADPLAFLLRKEGFEATVVADGPSALAEFERAGADIVLLDLMLPGMSGTDVCKQLRSRSSVPVIMVTARDSEIDKVVGLELGADDYMAKPFSPRELIARVKAVLRRARGSLSFGPAGATGRLLAGDLEVDVAAREVESAGRPVALTVREFELLTFLMSHPHHVFRREELLEHVWGYTFGDTSTVTVHVRRLREKIEPDPANPSRIKTVWGVGYRFEP
jgi:two-component system response regulator RegX3